MEFERIEKFEQYYAPNPSFEKNNGIEKYPSIEREFLDIQEIKLPPYPEIPSEKWDEIENISSNQEKKPPKTSKRISNERNKGKISKERNKIIPCKLHQAAVEKVQEKLHARKGVDAKTHKVDGKKATR